MYYLFLLMQPSFTSFVQILDFWVNGETKTVDDRLDATVTGVSAQT